MAALPVNKYFVINGEVESLKHLNINENEGSIYEVIRVLDSVPLFLEDHLDRFFHSAELSGKNIPYSESQIKQFLENLIIKNKVRVGNVLMSYKTNLVAFFIKHNYPKPELYSDGVVCGILKAERNNPNAKVLYTEVRNRADQLIQEKKFYEVILLDHLGKITEGSRSNTFFISDNKLITSPAGKVLEGITRQKTIELAKELNIEVVEKEIKLTELKSFNAAFLTGTSPKILPISKIDAFKFDPKNKMVIQLIEKYDELIDRYIKENSLSKQDETSI